VNIKYKIIVVLLCKIILILVDDLYELHHYLALSSFS